MVRNRRRIREVSATLLIAASGCGCTTPLLTKQDYRDSVEGLRQGSAGEALAAFPQGEEGAFITSVERGYLGLLAGHADVAALRKHAAAVEHRLRFSASDTLQSLFYIETPEGYYASEHEIIWLHLLLGWAYAAEGDLEAAAVEARKSAYLLHAPWAGEGNFDDAMLRIFLATLWTTCGYWQDARVDLRVAAELDSSLEWARDLAERTTPPRHLALVLGGVGPEVYWDAKRETNLLRGFRHVGFRPQGARSDGVLADDEGTSIPVFRTSDSSGWYERHWQRDDAISELIEDSRYMNRMLYSGTKFSLSMGSGVIWGVVVGAAGIAAGGGLVYLSYYGGAGELAVLGVCVAAAGLYYGYEIIEEASVCSVSAFKDDLDASSRYRFVRFLPEYFWVGWSDEDLVYPLTFETAARASTPIRPITPGVPAVSVGFLDDVSNDAARRAADWYGSFPQP